MVSKVETRIGIPTSQARVWEVLADLEGWPRWNPFLVEVQGKLSIGAPIAFVQQVEGKPPETIHAQVNDWIPYEQIHIGRRLARGWAQSVRYIELEPLGPESCALSIGELFGGFLGDRIAKQQRRGLRAGFEAMAEALRAEALKAPATHPEDAPAAPDPAAKATEAAQIATTAGGSRKKKTLLKPPPINQYAPKPFGMKPPGGVRPGSK